MYSRFLLLIVSLAFCFSCAQVGTITGGDKDEIAPRIVYSSIEAGALNVQNKELVVLFDERVVLNKPLETAILMPKDAKLNIEHQNKKIVIRWDKPLEPNTTYSLSLNGTVKDFHEGNDSLYQWIFSTGSIIDSAKHFINVFDAFKEKPLSKAIVGLYDKYEDSLPRYFGMSDLKGLVQINAVKSGNYWIRAFVDENKNLFSDKIEKQGVIFKQVQITDQKIDSSNIFLSTPQQSNKKPIVKFIPPGLLAIHSEQMDQLKPLAFSNNQPIILSNKYRISKDSVIYEIPNQSDSISVINQEDTVSILLSKRDKEKPISITFLEKNNGNSDTILFYCSDIIKYVDSNDIKCISNSDTLILKLSFRFNQLLMSNMPKASGKYTIEFKEGSIIGSSGKANDQFKQIITKRNIEELGTLVLHRDSTNPVIIQLIKNGKVVSEQFGIDKEFLFSDLIPGNYQVRMIEDKIENGRWDAINLQLKTQTEKVMNSTETISVKANWDIKKSLDNLFSP